MTQEQWAAVDRYVAGLFLPADPSLEAALRANVEAGLPPHDVSPSQGKLLHLVARVHGARTILEIGTLGGYSTIWLGRALPSGGLLVTLEANPAHAQVAQANLARAGLTDVVDLLLGPALESLARLAAERRGPFDVIFIDADKPNNPKYLGWALELSRPGSVIIVDNVVRRGAVADKNSDDPSVLGVRRGNELLAAAPNVTATVIQTVGAKGYDGFAIGLVTGDS